ncbi:hypothetical protein EUGRSUZ_L00247 [Eucalyptus grandis]|uniref:Uncharacterized protein n=2 Tax=Eucalyptus grandis TaxID=71139 RepID=A0ACC3LRF7_EUCGR|nr:hypothetical protein EUGRSUZ_L00247 [Eucalyptus grandis]
MGVWKLEITIISAKLLKPHDVYLTVSLSGDQKQHAPVPEKGSMNPWSGHTFSFDVNEAAVHTSYLKFKIKYKCMSVYKKTIGEIDVQVRDLLGMGATGVKPEVIGLEVRSSSQETVAVLNFSYELRQQFLIAAPSVGMPVMGYPVLPASVSAPSYPPPAPGTGPPPSADKPATDYPPAAAPPAAYPPPMPGAAPYTLTAHPANAVPTYGYQPPAHVHLPAGHGNPAPLPPAAYPPPMPGAAPYTQTAHPANAVPTYGYQPPAHAHLPAGHGNPAPPPPAAYTATAYGAGNQYAAPPLPAAYPTTPTWAAPFSLAAHVVSILASGNRPPAHAHLLAGHGCAAPPPVSGGNFLQRLMGGVVSGVAVQEISDLLGSTNDPTQ